jgi:hypothetical protein
VVQTCRWFRKKRFGASERLFFAEKNRIALGRVYAGAGGNTGFFAKKCANPTH